MNSFKENNEHLNQMLDQGLAMDAFEQFYADSVTMQENETEAREGKDLNREQCGEFLKAHPDLKLQVLSVAYGENISIQEIQFDYTDSEGVKIIYPEVAVRKWKDGLVVNEKFYYSA